MFQGTPHPSSLLPRRLSLPTSPPLTCIFLWGLILQECQAKDWKEGGHKRECGAIKMVKEWQTWDWDTFDTYREIN